MRAEWLVMSGAHKGTGVKHEIQLGQKLFVVDDPNGSLARIDVRDQVVAHPDAEPVAVTVAAARVRQRLPEPLPNPNDPIQSIRARANLFDRIYHGRLGPFALTFVWFVVGVPSAVMGWEFWGVEMTRFHSMDDSMESFIRHIFALIAGEALPVGALTFLLHGTFSRIDRRKRHTS